MRKLIAIALFATACGAPVTTRLAPPASTAVPLSTPAPTPSVAAPSASLRPDAPGELPDPRLTPGEAQTRDLGLICASPIKVPRNVPYSVKVQVLKAYGVQLTAGLGYEFDHLIPLELGGANTFANLWPEFGPIPNPKDKVENRLHALVCTGKVTIEQAQHDIALNWKDALRNYGS